MGGCPISWHKYSLGAPFDVLGSGLVCVVSGVFVLRSVLYGAGAVGWLFYIDGHVVVCCIISSCWGV